MVTWQSSGRQDCWTVRADERAMLRRPDWILTESPSRGGMRITCKDMESGSAVRGMRGDAMPQTTRDRNQSA